MYARGDGVAKDEKVATNLYQRACKAGELGACSNLGQNLMKGRGVKRDEWAATRLFERACSGGFRFACFNLGLALESGKGIAKDQARANDLFSQACLTTLATQENSRKYRSLRNCIVRLATSTWGAPATCWLGCTSPKDLVALTCICLRSPVDSASNSAASCQESTRCRLTLLRLSDIELGAKATALPTAVHRLNERRPALGRQGRQPITRKDGPTRS